MTDDAPWLVVGLGNPGREYAGNRHNAGFMEADLLAYRGGVKFGGAKPLTFMNLSGAPVAALCQFFKVPVENVVAVHDELDVPFGQVRAKRGGGEGGHNGLRSMSKSLAAKEYARVRFGIGRPPGRQGPAGYVLSDFAGAERKE